MPSKTTRRRYRSKKQAPVMRKVARQEAKKVINREVETKIWEGAGTSSTVSILGANFVMTETYSPWPTPVLIQQGSGDNQYIGDKIRPYYLEIRYDIVNASTDKYNVVGIMVMQARGAFLINHIDAGSFWTGYNTIFAPISYTPTAFDDRYKMLARRTHSVAPDQQNNVVTGYIRIPGKRLTRIGFQDNIGTVESGKIWVTAISDSLAASHPTLNITWRLHYKDA